MSESRENRRKSRTSRSGARTGAPGALAAPRAAPLARSESEWLAWTDALVDSTNLKVRKAGVEKEGAADELFRATFGQDWERALDPEGNPTEAYTRVCEREGRSLRLDHAERVRDYVIIGALNHHRRDAAWRGLEWAFKLELVKLLGPDIVLVDGRRERHVAMDRFKEGLAFACGQNVGTAHLHQYVQEHTPASSTGRPRGQTVTLPRAGRFVETGVMLGSEEQRAKFVERVQALPAKARRALLKDLRETHENLGTLLGEIEDDEE